MINREFLDKDEKIPVISIRSFETFYIKEFATFCKKGEIRKLGNKIVIDLRGNVGGDAHNVNQVAQYLFTPPACDELNDLIKKNISTLSPYTKQYVEGLQGSFDISLLLQFITREKFLDHPPLSAEEFKLRLESALQSTITICEFSKEDRQFIDDLKRLTINPSKFESNKEIYILIDQLTASACFELIRVARNFAKKVVIIGDYTIKDDKYTGIVRQDAIPLGKDDRLKLQYPTVALTDPLTVTPDYPMPKTKAELLELVMRN